MSISARISKSVDTAFDAVGDVKKDFTLTPKTVTGFNHVTQTLESSTPSPITVKGIEIARRINKEGKEEIRVLFKHGDMPKNTYQTLSYDGRTYIITGFEPTMNFITEVTATKEN